MAKYRLYTPGPTDLPETIRAIQARPLVYHREAAFSEILERVLAGLREVFQTKHRVFVLTSSGTGAMEAAVTNLVSPGDEVLVASCGRFGERWKAITKQFGAEVRAVDVEYRRPVDPETVRAELARRPRVKYIFTTLTETSTGAVSDIRELGRVARAAERLLVVDAIAGLGADPMEMDAWGVDVAVGGSQKAIACPPGTAFIAVGDRAWKAVEQARAPRYYWDLRSYDRFLEKGQTPYTPAITNVFTLDYALAKVVRRTVKSSWERHARAGAYVRKALTGLGLDLFPLTPSNALTVVRMPEGLDGTRIVDLAKTRHHVLFANGQGEMRGRIVRFGHMGNTDRAYLDEGLRAFRKSYERVSRG